MTFGFPTMAQFVTWLHALAAFLSAIGMTAAIVVNVLHAFNSGIPTNTIDFIGAVGAGFLALSKGIDSWNSAQVAKAGIAAGLRVVHPVLAPVELPIAA